PKNMLKTLVFRSTSRGLPLSASSAQASGVNPTWVVAVVRGDHDVNEAKLKKAAKEIFLVGEVAMLDSPEVRQNWAIGFVGPDAAVKRADTVVVIDPDAAQGGFWATGANEVDHHVK